MERHRVRALVVLFYLGATALMTQPFLNWHAFSSAIYAGDARLMAWTLAWDAHALGHGLPLLKANIYFPDPGALTYTDPMLGIALFAWPLQLLTHNAVLAYNVMFVAAFVLNGLAMHLLAWRLTRSHAAALVAGCVFAFSFYMMLHGHGHLSLIWTWLLPLAVVLLQRWFEGPTMVRAAVLGLVVLLQVLASWYLAIIVLLALTWFALWFTCTTRPSTWLGRSWQLLLAASCVATVIWPLAAPYRHSLPVPEAREVREFSADVASYLVPPLNTAIGQMWVGHIDQQPRWIWGELTMFLGWVALTLAFGGVVVSALRQRWRIMLPYALLAVIGFGLSLGPAEGRHAWPTAFDLLSRLPGVSAFRVPARFGLLVLFSVAVLASLAVADLHARMGRRVYIVLVCLLPLMGLEWFVVQFPAGKPQPVEIPAVYRHPLVAQAKAIVSLPDYWNTPRWFDGADYLLYSTSHWRPIVNGYGRGAPKDYSHEISHMRAFPGPNNARTLRDLGVDVVVVHGDRYGPDLEAVIAAARSSIDYELVDRIGSDYLFRVRPPAG